MVYERDHDHNDDVAFEREGTGMGTILGIILAIVVVLAIIWFFFLGGLGNNGNTNTAPNEDTNITTDVNNNVDPGANPAP